MSFLKDMLQKNKPETWVDVNYSSTTKTYRLFELSSSADEFRLVNKKFQKSCNKQARKISRIQHPYAYLSFKINCQYKNVPKEHIKVHIGPARKPLAKYLTYNCDERVSRQLSKTKYIQMETMSRQYRDSSGAHSYPMYLIRTYPEYVEEEFENLHL